MHICQSYTNETGKISEIVLINWMCFQYKITVLIYLLSIFQFVLVSFILSNWLLAVSQSAILQHVLTVWT